MPCDVTGNGSALKFRRPQPAAAARRPGPPAGPRARRLGGKRRHQEPDQSEPPTGD